MKIKTFVILICALIILPISGSAQIYNTQVEAKIEIISNGEFYKITGFSINKTENNFSLRYVLSVIKKDPNNNLVKNEQEGRFVLESNQKKVLSTTTINVGDEDRTIILLLVYDIDETILGKNRIVLNDYDSKESLNEDIKESNKISDDANFSGADGVFLKGIVIENTKTKPGRDFYRKYYLEYQKIGIKGERIVTINEILSLGNTTKIQLLIGDEIVAQFFVNPRSDYIDQMVEYSIKQTNNYFSRIRNNRNIVRKY